MELKKKYIHMSHEKGRAMSQVTLDDDYNVPESKPDIVRIITTKGAIHLEEAKAETGHVLLRGNLGFQVLYRSDGEENDIAYLEGEIPFSETVNLDLSLIHISAGINVTRYKYLATCIGGGIAGLGGLYFVMEYLGGTWTNNGFGDRGWLAIALVIFALWKPVNAIWGSFLFGALYILYLYIPGLTRSSQEIFKMLPYVVTIVVLIITSFRKKRENQPPASLGESYFREER